MEANKDPHEGTAVAELRLLFLNAAGEHPEIRLVDSLRDRVISKLDGVPNLNNTLLRDWAAYHHLEYDWVLEEARLLCGVSIVPKSSRIQVPRDGFLALWPVYAPPQITLASWVKFEPVSDYRERMLQRCESELEAYIEAVRRARRVLEDRGSQENHRRWAAEHVCLKRAFVEIQRVDSPHLSPQAVQGAVTKLLKKIGILPRPRKKTS
jgi:hypothetical protein